MSDPTTADPVARRQAALLPTAPGVYRFRDAQGRALYIGRAVDLRRRVLSYWGDAAEVRGLRRMVAAATRLEAIECDSPHEAAWLERNLLERRRPRWNRAIGGEEVPVWITVTLDVRRPGLRLVHEHEMPHGPLLFGPYLGGRRVRLALAALHRVAPLAWTGTGITGSERAMAGRLGVGPADGPGIGRLLVAILGREPSAVAWARQVLLARRDAAAERLDFETAATARDELKALAWLTAPQRVTMPDAADRDLAAWQDGHLLTLSIHAGRLDEWGVRSMGAGPAADRVARTPPEWRAFTERAVALAARLAAALDPGLPLRAPCPGANDGHARP